MRIILLCLVMLPLFSRAQINRSATELARENIQVYLENKLFKDQPCKPVSYGQLKSRASNSSEIMWSLEYRFEITETKNLNDKKEQVRKPYKFVFFMDKKMEVLKAEGAYVE